MTNTFKLNFAIKNSGYKLEFIAKKIGLSRTGLYNKINGVTEFYGSEIQKISTLLNLSNEEREDIFFKNQVD